MRTNSHLFLKCFAATGSILATLVLAGATAQGAVSIVEDGQPRAQIVIAADAVRTVSPAAEELQAILKRISGATLPIVTPEALDSSLSVRIYVGRSSETDRLGITDEGLAHGAFRMVSGPDYLVLLGQDRAFEPRKPFAVTVPGQDQAREEWDTLTGGLWENPLIGGGQAFLRQFNAEKGLWAFDTFGSFNAVSEFLYSLGVRWYLPDPLGEVIPQLKTITLPEVDRTVRPDFPLRYPYQYGRRFSIKWNEELQWQLRMGFDMAVDTVGPLYVAHGTANVIKRDSMKKAHPEYYALIGGERQNGAKYKPCLSSEGLINENVAYARAVFDIYNVPMISVMPTDGFTSICQCDGCQDGATPERGWEGSFSDYVWTYVDRVARELYKSHPDRKVIAMAYTTYMLPPETLATLSSNIVVLVAQGRCYNNADPSRIEKLAQLRKAWLAKFPVGGQVLAQYEYYRWAVPGKGFENFPAFGPHAISDDLRALKGHSLGDYIEVHRGKGLDTMGVTGLNLYVTGRCWWDANLDVDALLDEYYTLYYGPAREEMKALIEFSETDFMAMRKDPERIEKVLAWCTAAKAKAAAAENDIYAQRVALVTEYLEPLTKLRDQLRIGRDLKNLPLYMARDFSADRTKDGPDRSIVIDGKLDDPFWQGVTGNGTGQLKIRKTNDLPPDRTRVQVAWAEGNLYLGITASDRDMANLAIATEKNEDMALWDGDCIEIMIETDRHSYYQFAVNPAGAMLDVDRGQGINTLWTSDAEVAVQRGEDSWTVEIRIPLADESQADIDALNGMAGNKPSETYPWFFNVGRQRVRDGVRTHCVLSPTAEGFHDVEHFARLISR